jgi:flagellar biosynthesis protein FlhA
MGSDIVRQLTSSRMPLRIAGFSALALCLIPGLPKIPFLFTGGVMLLASSRVKEVAEESAEGAPTTPAAQRALADTPEQLAADIQVDPLGLELSVDILDLVDSGSGGDLLDRVQALRRKVAMEIGILIPPVRTRDNIDLPSRTYVIKLFGIEVARGEAPPGSALAIGDFLGSLPGEPTTEPVYGLQAKWIPLELARQAELGGATVVDRTAMITTHLADVVSTYAARLLGREEVKLLTDVVKRHHPVVIDELTPALLTLGQVQQVLQSLLEEGVSIRDLVRIYEALSLRAAVTKDHDTLVAAARAALGPAVVAPHVHDGVVNVITFEPSLEQRMLEALRPSEEGPVLVLDPVLGQRVVSGLGQLLLEAENRNMRPVLACAPQIRLAVRRMVGPAIERLPVLSYNELTGSAHVRSAGVINVDLMVGAAS